MSAEDDNPLVGWSRRKRAARKESAARSVPAPAAEGEAERHAAPAGRRPPEASPAGQDAPARPPPLGDLTPEHDLSAFLQKGIPESLKNAALRKMWSLDPAIRDYTGLAENDWDFTRPDTIPGFGSIAGSTAAPDFFSTPQPDRPLAAEAPVGSVRPPEAAEAHERIEEAPRAIDTPPLENPLPSRSGSAPEADDGEDSDTREPAVAARHGGALPRE